mgnify:FL=1
MDGIKASGSENLYGKDKLNRMLELAGVKNTVNESTNTIYTTAIQYKHAPNGKTYGIFREGQQYFIKEATTTENLTVESFDYIDGLRFKNDNKYSSYSAALKRLNLMFNEFNYTELLEEEVDMVRTDRLDEKKYIIKVPVTVSDEEVASPKGVEAEEEMDFDLGGDFEETEVSLGDEEEEVSFEDEEEGAEEDLTDFEDEETEEVSFEDEEEGLGDDFEEEEISFEDEESGEEEEVSVEVEDEDETEKEIQKLAGKLSQKLRDLDGEDVELEKYAINMVISASHPEKMDMEDKEDIVDKLTDEPAEEEEVVDVEASEVELEETYDEMEEEAKPDFLDLDKDGNTKEPMKDAAKDAEEMEEMVDSDEMDEEMKKMEEKKAEVIYGEEEGEMKHPKIKVTKEGEIEIYENEEEKSDIVVESDEEVDEEYEKIMFESMIKRTVKKVLSK